VPIVVPCHRVVSATGLGGYSGVTQGLSPELATARDGESEARGVAENAGAVFRSIKRWLLDHERG